MAASSSNETAQVTVFRRLLVNSLASGVTSTFLWFAVTFWVYLETESIVTTAMIAGAFSLASAVLGIVFGTFVDRHRKHTVMVISSGTSLVGFLAAGVVYVSVEQDDLLQLTQPWFWLFVATILAGSVAGNMRSIALSTCVTLLVPFAERERANGLVGSVTGVSFAVTSVFSGLVVGQLGMGWALVIAALVTSGVLVDLRRISIPEPDFRPEFDHDARWIDLAGAMAAIRQTSGLMGLIMFAALNNLLGGVFMSLLDAYGLSLVSVEAWGLLWGLLSFGFILGGLIVARFGMGGRPLRLVIAGNLAGWIVCSVFALRSSILMLGIGMFLWLTLIPIVEAAEQTVLQRAVPLAQQGRVFGFAQTIENAATPLTAFVVGPMAEAVFVPFMTTGRGVDLIGSWFGTGKERGLALLFVGAGLVGILITCGARVSRSYSLLVATADRAP